MKEPRYRNRCWLSGPVARARPNVMARDHVVVSGHYYASLAGLQILEAGGNAIDAGVATGLAIDVLESQFVGFGGVAPVMLHLGDRGETHVISGVGVWPKAARHRVLPREVQRRGFPMGCCSTVVPAAPSIWITALERLGTMSFGDVAAAAIRLRAMGSPLIHSSGKSSRPGKLRFANGRPLPRSSCRMGDHRWQVRSSCRPIWPGRCNTWRIRSGHTRGGDRLAGVQRGA